MAENAIKCNKPIVVHNRAQLRAIVGTPKANNSYTAAAFHWAAGEAIPDEQYVYDDESSSLDEGESVLRPFAIPEGNPGRWIKYA